MNLFFSFNARFRGYSLTELVVAICLLSLVICLGFAGMRSVENRSDTLDSFNTFHMKSGTLLEAMKQDLRSAVEIQLASSSISILHVANFSSNGALQKESVVYSEAGIAVSETRDGKEKKHLFGKESSSFSRTGLLFELVNRREEGGNQLGLLKITIAAFDAKAKPVERLIASASVQIRALKIFP